MEKKHFGRSGVVTGLAVCLAAVTLMGALMLAEERPADKADERLSLPREPEPPAVETVLPVPRPVVQQVPEPPAPEVVMPEKPVDVPAVKPQAPSLVVRPLKGEVAAAFSADALAYSPTLEDWRTHEGLDIAAEEGTAVLSASAGTVTQVKDDPLLGTTVIIDHPCGVQTVYASLREKPEVKRGEKVSAGQIIGAVGTTAAAEAAEGPHLHFSVWKDGKAIDPEKFLHS